MFARSKVVSRLIKPITYLLLIGLLPALSIATAPTAQALSVTLADADALVFDHANVTNLVGTGTSVNDVIIYKNVGAFGGISNDAVVTTVAVSGSISNYYNPGSASTATGYDQYSWRRSKI